MRWGRKVWALSVQKMRSSPDSGTLFQVSNVLFHVPRHLLLTSINQTVSIFRRFCRSHRFCCWPVSGQVTAGDQIRNLNFWIPNKVNFLTNTIRSWSQTKPWNKPHSHIRWLSTTACFCPRRTWMCCSIEPRSSWKFEIQPTMTVHSYHTVPCQRSTDTI